MSSLFEELFLGVTEPPKQAQKPLVRPAQPAKPVQKPAAKPAAGKKAKPTKPAQKPAPLAEGEGSDVCAVEHHADEAYEIKAEENKDVLLENVERACSGNRYLEAMVLGEIVNSPRFKDRYKR